MTKVNMLEAKTNLSKLVEEVESGRQPEIIIARNGKPAARLVPIRKAPRQLGLGEGLIPDLTPEMAAEWDRENEAMWAEYLAKPLFPEMPVPVKGRKRA